MLLLTSFVQGNFGVVVLFLLLVAVASLLVSAGALVLLSVFDLDRLCPANDALTLLLLQIEVHRCAHARGCYPWIMKPKM